MGKRPRHEHSYLLNQFKKGSCYIYCGRCQKVTLHKRVKTDRMKATINNKVVAVKVTFSCSECGNRVTFKEKKI